MNLQEVMGKESKMQIESILDIVKKMDITKNEDEPETTANTATESKTETAKTAVDKSRNVKDIGRLLYDAENKFSPKPNKRMTAKMKEIETQNFAGTMDSIKSQIIMPTVSAQAAPSVDLTKYFPNQKQEKSTTNAVNKNQKNLKDVDLAKYFPSSPVPQKRSNVVTVAEKLKKSQTEKSLATTMPEQTTSVTSKSSNVKPVSKMKKQNSLGNSPAISLRDHQLDGAVDLLPKMSAVKMVTTKDMASSTPKAKVKMNKKLPAKCNNTKTKKHNTTTIKTKNSSELSVMPPDDSDKIFAEILQETNGAARSPSLDYQKLFQEEKSPSDDVSDKIERILQETGIDFGIPSRKRIDNPKKLLKTKSLGEAELELKADSTKSQTKEDGDRPSGVKNILKRFESLSSTNSDEHIFKLRRMESATGNIQKSRDSIVSEDTLGSTSDLEKTMDYLRSEWRSEATNFLQKKRDNFYAEKHIKENNAKEVTKQSRENELPVQYSESKLAKFFGLKAKSPEKRKSPIKKQKASSPKKQSYEQKNKKAEHHPKTSLEELANISNAKQYKKEQADFAKRQGLRDVKAQNVSKKLLESTQKIEDKEDNLDSMNSTAEILQKAISVASIQAEDKTVEKAPRSIVEDIRNLPKTGCDKSLSNSRRGSQTSLQSRRLSNTSLNEHLECLVSENIEHISTIKNESKSNMNNQENNNGLIMANANENIMDAKLEELAGKITEEQHYIDSLATSANCNTISRNNQESQENVLEFTKVLNIRCLEKFSNEKVDSESIDKEPKESTTETTKNVTPLLESELKDLETRSKDLQLRGSSENESIDNLFSQFSDEMLVNVEFDSNDELVDITPHPNIINDGISKISVNGIKSDDIETVEPLERLEKDAEQVNSDEISVQEVDLKTIRRDQVEENGILEEKINNLKKVQEPQFPIKPQRRHKSKSSSSESTAPIAPQRLKKKLAALNPNDMPPSVQDLLNEVIVRQIGEKQNEFEIPQFKESSKFPITKENVIVENDCQLQKQLPLLNVETELMSNDRTDYTKVEERAKATTETDLFLNNKTLLSHNPPITTEPAAGLPNSTIINNSNHRTSKIIPKIITPPKRQSKENSLEWDMEKMPASPMPRRKFVIAERGTSATSDVTLRDISPTSSIKLLNNLPDDTTGSEKRLIEAFEMERRQALVKRDQSYHEVPKPNLERRNSTKSLQSSSINTATNSSTTTSSSKLTPSQSRRDSLASKREGTPPMFKKLVIPFSDTIATTTAQTSRRSSFAFIDLENSEPIVAPMPKKLSLPKYEPKYVPEDGVVDADAEVFKNRPWPKQFEEPLHEDDEDESDEDNEKLMEKSLSRTPSPIAEVFKNRQWPDGSTNFSRQDKEAPPKPLNSSDDIEVLLAKRRAARRNKTTLSQSPQPPYSTLGLRKANKNYSKSINDLQKNSPLQSTYNSTQSLHKLTMPSTTRSSYSSMDTEYKTNTAEQMPKTATQRVSRHTTYNDDVDTTTQLLLDRGKRLHNRKRDFVNERVVERNPYMRDVIKADISTNVDDEEINSYRPHNFNTTATSTALKFPISRSAGRSTGLGSTSYDYLNAGKPTFSTHATIYGSNRYLPTITTAIPSPISHLNFPSEHLRQPIGSTSSLYRRSPHRGHLVDYFKRGHNERGNSKDSCVIS